MSDIWLIGGTVTGAAFDSAGQEASAVALEGLGHTVTRISAATLSAQPTLTDCDLVIHMVGSVGSETALRATAANAAPVLGTNTYYMANLFGHLAVNSSAPSTTDSDDEIVITNIAQIDWTAGYAVNDAETVAPFSIYMERLALAGAAAGAFIWSRSGTNAFAYVGYGWDAGITNLAGQTTTARIATWHIFDFGIGQLNADGLQILDDLIAWAIGDVTEPSISVPATAAFGSVPTAAGTTGQTITVANVGDAALNVSGVSITGTHAADFSIQSGGGAFTVPAGDDHDIVVRFDPSADGARTATLEIASNDPDDPTVAVALSGTGTAAPPFTPGGFTGPRRQPTQLGAGTYSVEVRRLSPAGNIADPLVLPLADHGVKLVWGRRLNQVSKASVSLAGLNPMQHPQVSQIRSLWHELTIIRSGEPVWSGPIERIARTRSGIDIVARDVAWWLAGHRPGQARRGSWDVAQAVFTLINQSHPGRTYGVVVPSTSSLRVDVVTDPATMSSTLEELNGLAGAGAQWTALGNRILAGSMISDGNNRQARFPKLTDRDFLNEIIAEERGDLAATDVYIIGDGVIGYASASDVPAAFRITKRFTRNKIVSLRDANRAAAQELAARWPIPIVVSVPPGSAISPSAPMSIGHAIPGAVGVIESQAMGGQTMMRLDALDVIAEGGVETVKGTFVPTLIPEA